MRPIICCKCGQPRKNHVCTAIPSSTQASQAIPINTTTVVIDDAKRAEAPASDTNAASKRFKATAPTTDPADEQGEHAAYAALDMIVLILKKMKDDWICLITMELPKDPVIAEDGQTYERSAIA